VRWRRVETEAGFRLGEANGWVDPNDGFEVFRDPASKVSRPEVVGSELSLETLPRNQRRLLEIAHPVGEPGVEVDGQGGGIENVEGSQVDRHCRTGDLCKEILAQDDVRSPFQSAAICSDLCRRFKGGKETHLPPTSLLEKVNEGTEQLMLDDSLTSDPLQVTLVE